MAISNLTANTPAAISSDDWLSKILAERPDLASDPFFVKHLENRAAVAAHNASRTPEVLEKERLEEQAARDLVFRTDPNELEKALDKFIAENPKLSYKTNEYLKQTRAGIPAEIERVAKHSAEYKRREDEREAKMAPHREAEKRVMQIDAMTNQILNQGTYGHWTGDGRGEPALNARRMAEMFYDIGMTDINQFGKVTVAADVAVTPVYEQKLMNDPELGEYMGQAIVGYRDANGKSVDPSLVRTDYDEFGNFSYTAPVGTKEVFGNKETGAALNAQYDRAQGNIFSGTYAGEGSTGFGVQFKPDGTPVFYTQFGGSTNTIKQIMDDLGPIGQIALAVATGGLSIPQQIAAQAALSLASGADIKDVAKNVAVNFVMSKIPGADLIQDGTKFLNNIDTTGILGDAFRGAATSGAKAAITNKDIGDALLSGAVGGATAGAIDLITSSSDLFKNLSPKEQTAVKNVISGVASGQNLEQALVNTAITAAKNELRNQTATGGITNRIVDDTIPQGDGITKTLTDSGLIEFGDQFAADAAAMTESDIAKLLESSGLANMAGSVDTGDLVAGPSGMTTRTVASMPQMQARPGEVAGDVREVRDEEGFVFYRRDMSYIKPDGTTGSYTITYDPNAREGRQLSYGTASNFDPNAPVNFDSPVIITPIWQRPDTAAVDETLLPGASNFDGSNILGQFFDSSKDEKPVDVEELLKIAKGSATTGAPTDEAPKSDAPAGEAPAEEAPKDSTEMDQTAADAKDAQAPTEAPAEAPAESPPTKKEVAATDPDNVTAPVVDNSGKVELTPAAKPTPTDTKPTANATPQDVEKIVSDALKANPNLTKEDVQKVVSDAVATIPNLTADQVKEIVGAEVSKLPVGASPSDVQNAVDKAKADLTKAIDAVGAGAASGNAELKKALEDMKAAGLTPEDVQKAVDASAASQSAATKQAVEAATKGLATSGALDTAKNDLAKEIQAAKDIGLQGDAALQAGLDSMAAKMGVNQAEVLKQLGTSTDALRKEFGTGFAEVTAAQKAEADARAAQGKELQGAITGVAGQVTGLEGQLTAQGKAFADQLVQQGMDYKTALQTAIDAQSALFGTQISGVQADIAANEARRIADQQAAAAAAEAQRQADREVARKAEIRSGIKTTAVQGAQQLQNIQQQLPQALRMAQEVSTPIYGQMGPYLDVGSDLDFGFFKPSPEKQAGTKQQQPTKIAAGGYIDDLLAGDMTADDLLNLLR
jgi:hypothetical protein